MVEWTTHEVETRLVEAADVLKRLPEQKVRGYFNVWPEMVYDFSDKVGQTAEPMRRPPPSASSITRMEETLEWLQMLNGEDAKMVWARAEGMRWKPICWRFGISRATAARRWEFSLSVIALKLNGQPVQMRRARAMVINRARKLSMEIAN